MPQQANEGKALLITVDGVQYARTPVKTHVITDKDTFADVLTQYAKPLQQQGDIVFVSEKAVACTQKRAIPMKEIHPRWLARFLCKFVYKNPYGIGLSIPQTMEMALQECGTVRILFAAFISIIGKLFGKRGWFYQIAGEKARSIDGPCDCTIPPYNEYVVLGPLDPDKAAAEAAEKSGCPLVCVVDINDLGGNILGTSKPEMDREWLVKILKDNPLGQSDEQTPLGIIRVAKEPDSQENPINTWVLAHREQILADLRRIVKIRSVSQPGDTAAPFGQGCRDALDEMLALCAEYGFTTVNDDYYCGSAVLPGSAEPEIAFWSHLDVVPESGDWAFPPYAGKLIGDFMIGRGVRDNKCAAIAGLYVMRYLKEQNIPMKSTLRTFFGCNEECGMLDQAHYIKNHKLPDYSIIADWEFPVCYGEKGILTADLTAPVSSEILGLSAGLVSNMVADHAEIQLKKTDALLEKLAGIENAEILEDHVVLTATGQASHAAHPQGSLNAIGVLAEQLLRDNLLNEADRAVMAFIGGVCSDYTGTALGIAAGHPEFGALTCIGGMLSLVDGKAVLNVNIRYPYSEKGADISDKIAACCAQAGFEAQDIVDHAPSYVERDSAFVGVLQQAFTGVTGKSLPAYIMSGGTYARNLPNAVVFGPAMPSELAAKPQLPEGHGFEHEPDEALNITEFLQAVEIYIRAVIALDATL